VEEVEEVEVMVVAEGVAEEEEEEEEGEIDIKPTLLLMAHSALGRLVL
jgi:preprotein translocase subunit Sec61beta